MISYYLQQKGSLYLNTFLVRGFKNKELCKYGFDKADVLCRLNAVLTAKSSVLEDELDAFIIFLGSKLQRDLKRDEKTKMYRKMMECTIEEGIKEHLEYLFELEFLEL